MSNLEHLKKQAKLYLRWHREGHVPVAAQIRRIPRFQCFTDREVLAADFRLADAQELVARRAGWETWPALLKDLQAMPATTHETTNGGTVITAAEPMLLVRDIPTSLSFYSSKLDFHTVFSYGEPPFYAQVARGGARLNLRQICGPIYVDDFRQREPDVLSATLTVDDAKALFLELRQVGIDFHQSLRTEPWGARTFIVSDPDGNLLCFAGHGGEP